MLSNKVKKWKKFENKTTQVIKNFNSNSDVYENVYITGKFSKSPRQVDVKLVDSNDYDFMVFECKDKSHSIDTPVVEAFVTKLKDLGARKGAIVSNSPYTKGAQNMANEFDIDLLHLVDSSDSDIRTVVYATSLIIDVMPKHFNVGFGSSSIHGVSFVNDVKKLEFVDSDGNSVTAYQIFINLWNNMKELSHTPGLYTYSVPNNTKIYIQNANGDKVLIENLHFNYEVIEKYFLGSIKIIDTSGIYNVKEKSYRTRSLKTEEIVPYEVEKIWQEINNPNELMNKVSFTMNIVSMYTDESL